MKLASLSLPLSALLLMGTTLADTTSSTYPGRCETTDDCSTYGSNYACVAVTTDIAGLEQLTMCIPGDQVCSGRIAGICPTFASWPSKYRVVQPVCAFVEVENCDEQYNVTVASTAGSGSNATVDDESDVTVSSASGNGTVQCFSRNFTAAGESVVVNGIYQCMDQAKFVASNGGHIQNLTDTTIEQCGWNDSTLTLCSGQGTCSPLVAFSQDYECKCNAGYNESDYCYEASSNECSSVAQCGTEGTCDLMDGATVGECTCNEGATGDQCLLCDSTAASDVVCNGHGSCSTAGVCTCSSGYNGTFCEEEDSSSSSNTKSPASIALQSVGMSLAALLVAVFLA